MAVILLFIDGVGVGPLVTENPFSSFVLNSLNIVAGEKHLIQNTPEIKKANSLYKKIDACLGLEGLPQSGTGQATLFSGQNAAKMIGKHFGPFPHSGIKHLLKDESLFKKIQNTGFHPFFMNAFPAQFFERAAKTNRWSCTTLMTKNANIPLNSLEEVLKGKAITAEIMQDYWKSLLNLDVPEIAPEEAAQRVLQSADIYDLVLTEFYLTDKAGHEKNDEMASAVIDRFDRFATHILKNAHPDHTVVITSDHGNVEDLSTKSHTRNPVPLIVRGKGAVCFHNVSDLTGITPAILDALSL